MCVCVCVCVCVCGVCVCVCTNCTAECIELIGKRVGQKDLLFLEHQFLDNLVPQGFIGAVGYTLLNNIAGWGHGERGTGVLCLWLIPLIMKCRVMLYAILVHLCVCVPNYYQQNMHPHAKCQFQNNSRQLSKMVRDRQTKWLPLYICSPCTGSYVT